LTRQNGADAVIAELLCCMSGAHPMSQVTRVEWLDNETVVTSGHDSCIKQWLFKLNWISTPYLLSAPGFLYSLHLSIMEITLL